MDLTGVIAMKIRTVVLSLALASTSLSAAAQPVGYQPQAQQAAAPEQGSVQAPEAPADQDTQTAQEAPAIAQEAPVMAQDAESVTQQAPAADTSGGASSGNSTAVIVGALAAAFGLFAALRSAKKPAAVAPAPQSATVTPH